MGILTTDRIVEEVKKLGFEMSLSQAENLSRYAALLMKWNGVYNLTSLSDEEDVLRRHLLDSLTLVKAVSFFKGMTVLDVGSGGGLPAIPLAIMKPEVSVTMVDAVKKKVLFLRQVILELQLKNAKAEHARVENLRIDPVDMVTSRAFASLKDNIRLTENLLKPTGYWCLMKGKLPEEEIRELPNSVVVEKIQKLHVPDSSFERHLIWIRRGEC